MKKTTFIKLLSCVLCVVLIAAMALIATSCSDNSEMKTEDTSSEEKLETPVSNDSQDSDILGEGEHHFTFIVKDGEGNETSFEIKSDESIVGDALLEHDLIAGDEGDYGLYVKTVNGITADYDTDGTYWAFYIDGEYAMTGVDQTEITDGAVYMFAVEG